MATKLKFGLLLPHFCEYASTELCIEGAKKAETYGFDSVWVRDHLVFEPHGMPSKITHFSPLTKFAMPASRWPRLSQSMSELHSRRSS